MSRPGIALLLFVVGGVASACSSSHPHAAPVSHLSAARFKADVQALDQPFAQHPLPVDLAAGAARYDGFAASVEALDVAPGQIGERATLVSAIHACSEALRAHPDLGSAQPIDYRACFATQTLIQAMPA